MSQEVFFTFKDGAVEIEGSGFKGKSCDTAIGRFLTALGGPVAGKKLKPEYHEVEPEQLAEQQAGTW